MAATRRLTKELQDLKTQSPKVFRDIIVDAAEDQFSHKNLPPNISEQGYVCLPIINSMWSPATNIEQIIQSLLEYISEPEPNNPFRYDLALEFTKDNEKFMKNAEEFTIKHAEKRPE